ncbi:MAG: peptidase M15 [Streptosporangiales bacterium]|nr:peptidase M15 [Streptosporangiales bacterium]
MLRSGPPGRGSCSTFPAVICHRSLSRKGADVPVLRAAALAVICTVIVSLFVSSGAQAAPQSPANKTTLTELRRKAEKAVTELERGNQRYQDQQDKLERSQESLVRTLHQVQRADLKLAKMRAPLGRMANAAYKSPQLGSLGALVTNGQPEENLRAASDLEQIVAQREDLVGEASGLRKERLKLASSAQLLQAQQQLEKVQLDQQAEELKKKSKTATAELVALVKKLGLRVDRYLRFDMAKCDARRGDEAKNYPNGLIPESALCTLPQDGERLRADAAVAFMKMNEAYIDRFGNDMCVNDSYRNLAEQQQVYAERPGFAAVPGRSNHGWGLAVDLGCGVQNYGSEQFNWLTANAGRYGWIHPAWANSSPFEPWHWEYEPSE